MLFRLWLGKRRLPTGARVSAFTALASSDKINDHSTYLVPKVGRYLQLGLLTWCIPNVPNSCINYQCSSVIRTSFTSTPSTNQRPSPLPFGPIKMSFPDICRLRIFPVSWSNVQSSSP